MQTTLDVAALANAILWPTAVLIAVVWFRAPLRELASAIVPRVNAIKLGDFSLEFSEATQLRQLGWSGGAVDLRRAGQPNDVNDSTQRTFFEQIRDPTSLDYAVVDLGTGESWLTSRLFILSVLLRRMRGLDALVFVKTVGDTRRCYIGVATSEAVRWRLAARYPHLELAFHRAWAWDNPPDAATLQQARVVDDYGRLGLEWDPSSPEAAGALLRGFLAAVQAPGAPPPGEAESWVTLGTAAAPILEHARWVSPAELEQALGDALDPTHLRLEYLQPLSDEERVRACVRQGGRFVAVTRDDRVFNALIDRARVVEQVATQAIK